MEDGVEQSALDKGELARRPLEGVREYSDSGPRGRFDLETWRGQVTDLLLISASAIGAVLIAGAVVRAIDEPQSWPQTVASIVVYVTLLALTLLRTRLEHNIRAWGLLLAGYAVAGAYLALLGLLGNGVVLLVVLPALGAILVNLRAGVVLAVLSAGLYLLFTVAAATGVMADWLTVTDNTLAASQWLGQGLSLGLILAALMLVLARFYDAQAAALAEAQHAAEELAAAQGALAASGERDRYTALLETVAGISHDISGVLARDELLRRAVDSMATRLGLRGVAVYLAEPASGALLPGPTAGEVHVEATSMRQVPQVVADLARTVREKGMAGRVASTGEVRGQAGEVALPLHVGAQWLGVLYVAWPGERPLTDPEVQPLHLLADQLAVALDNTRLFGEAEARLDELNALQRQYTAEAWAGFVADRPRPAYTWQPPERYSGPPERYSGPMARPGDVVWHEMLDRVRAHPADSLPLAQAREQRPVVGYDQETNQHVVVVPVRLREVVIGVLAFHRPRDAAPWQPEEVAAIEAVAARLAFAAENLRLLEQTQRRAARDRIVDQIARQMQASLDPETILKVAVREVGRALGASQSLVEIRPEGYSGRPEGYSGPDSGARGRSSGAYPHAISEGTGETVEGR